MLQDGHRIAYASKAFTSSQKKYAQVEKELADVLFRCQRFMSNERLQEAMAATNSDVTLPAVRDHVLSGTWPTSKLEVPGPIKSYWEMQDELTVEQGLLLKNHKLIIPTSMRRLIIEKIHHSHQGVEKSKKVARDIFFCPGMARQIEDVVAKCEICNRYRNQNPKESMKGHAKPSLPWQKIATDFFSVQSRVLCCLSRLLL